MYKVAKPPTPAQRDNFLEDAGHCQLDLERQLATNYNKTNIHNLT